MSNDLLTPSIIGKEALLVLENNLVMANLVHRDISQEFQHVGSTITIRKPASFTATAFSTTVAVQDVTESSVQVVLDQHLDVSFEVTTSQLSLDIVDFSMQCIQPAMRAIAQRVDSLLTALYADVSSHQAVSSTEVVEDIARLRSQLNLRQAPFGSRYLVMAPETEAAYISLDAFLNADKRGDGPTALKEAHMGRVMGFDCYMDQNIATHSIDATFGDQAAAMKGAATAGAAAATIDALTDDDVIEDNALFKVAGDPHGYRITDGPHTVASTAITVVFDPALSEAAADNAVVTFQAEHLANMGFHKNAFALVTAPLAPPLGGAAAATLNYKGLSCRVVYDYTMSTKTNAISIDLLCGVKTLDSDLAAILCDAQNV